MLWLVVGRMFISNIWNKYERQVEYPITSIYVNFVSLGSWSGIYILLCFIVATYKRCCSTRITGTLEIYISPRYEISKSNINIYL